MINSLLELIFPKKQVCPLCDRAKGLELVCKTCQNEFKSYQTLPRCSGCGGFIQLQDIDSLKLKSEIIYCDDCLGKEHSFKLARAAGPYEGLLKELLGSFKYTGVQSLAKVFATFMADEVINESKFHELLKDVEHTLLVPVPLSEEREQQRGFNQSRLLANELGQILSLEVVDKVLIKVVNTPSQAKLGKEARIKNLKGVFKLVNSELLREKNILLIDDIFTTGSTVEECTKLLRSVGVKNVYVLTVAAGYKSTTVPVQMHTGR